MSDRDESYTGAVNKCSNGNPVGFGVYSVIDIAIGHFEVPFFCRNDDVAKNAIINSFIKASPDSVLRISPKMYHLRRIGVFDSSGLFEVLPVSKLILRFDEIVLPSAEDKK